jgi:hypothetical protein
VDLILRNLAPNRTASIQLYQRGTNTTVGSAIAGTSSVYDYTFPNIPTGDFDYSLIGFTALPSSRRSLRSTAIAVYEAATWWEIETAVRNGVPIVPNEPGRSALQILCLDQLGNPEPNVVIDSRIIEVPSGDQNLAYKGSKQSATSDSEGYVILSAIKGAVYEYKRGKAEVWAKVIIGQEDSTDVQSIIGSP